MSNELLVKRRLTGLAGAPTGGVAGELAVNTGTSDKELWFYNGAGWDRLNPPGVNPNVVGVTAAVTTGNVETAFNAQNINVTAGDIVIYTFGAPPQAYIYTGGTGSPVAAATAANFTALGGGTVFSTTPDVLSGTSTTTAINPAALRAEITRLLGAGTNVSNTGSIAVATSAGAGDAGKLVKLDTGGKIDVSQLPISTDVHTAGAIDFTAAPSAGVVAGTVQGSLFFATADGTIEGTWPADIRGKVINSGDGVLFDGTNWHLLPNQTDLNDYVPKAGATTMAANAVWTFAPASGAVVQNFAGGALDGAVIDCGTF